LVHADDFSILDVNTYTMKENTETLLEASSESGLELNIEKTECMAVPCHWNTG